MKITNEQNDQLLYKHFLFPSGEVGVKLCACPKFFVDSKKIKIIARINDSNDFIQLAMIKDAIENEYLNTYQDLDIPPIRAVIPKLPYAQQDRVTDRGESLSIKVFANLLNSLGFNSITILDPHSNVSPPLINKVKVVTRLAIINKFNHFVTRVIRGNNVFLAPDAGSISKTSEVAKFFERSFYVKTDKMRDLTNGKIIGTVVHCDDFEGKDIIICDDICLGGATFTEIAKICKTRNCGKIVLFVTHGVFNKGVDELFNNGIDEIFTTNSYQNIDNPKVNVLDIENIL